MTETWKDAAGYEGFYQVSSEGRIRSVDRISKCSRGSNTRIWKGRILATNTLAGRGYVSVSLAVNGKNTKVNLHRLIAQTFVPNPLGKPEVNHKDSDKLNNAPSNLEWLTKEEHASFGYHVEGKTTPRKLDETKVSEIRALLSEGMKQKDIAEAYGISQSNVSFINTERTWYD